MVKHLTLRNIAASFISGLVAGGVDWLLSKYWLLNEEPLRHAAIFAGIFVLLNFFVIIPIGEKEKAKREHKNKS